MRTAAVIRDMAETEIPELNISNLLGRFSPPEPVFETKSMVWFRSAEDFISYFGWNFPRKFFRLHGVAYRYFSDELCGRRLYYLVTAFLPDGGELKIVAEGPTDYSGSGKHQKELIEFFITKHLKLMIKEFPVSYLIDALKGEITHKHP
jgi:hypothetical protein